METRLNAVSIDVIPGIEVRIPPGLTTHCGYVALGKECPHTLPVGVPKEVAAAEYAARRGLRSAASGNQDA